MKKKLAFVLSGGGGRGALEVGALAALFEAGYHPDILVGASIGAANAVTLGLKGVDQVGIAYLYEIYRDIAGTELLPQNYLTLAFRAVVKRPVTEPSRRMREFFISHGITPELSFSDLHAAKVLIVSTDINHYRPVVHGLDPTESVLEGLCASTAIPPWITPIEKDDMLLMDGGVVSNLPIEAALSSGATDIIALDVNDRRVASSDNEGFSLLLNKLINTVQHRHTQLELALASAAGVSLSYIHLTTDTPIPIWQFNNWEELAKRGHEQAYQHIQEWKNRPRFWRIWKTKK